MPEFRLNVMKAVSSEHFIYRNNNYYKWHPGHALSMKRTYDILGANNYLFINK